MENQSVEKERYVLIDGDVSWYKEKAPFEASGSSIMGALEYDPETKQVKCHECGAWKLSLIGHLTHKHKNVSVRNYKLKHGLKQGSALVGEELRGRFMEIGKERFSGQSKISRPFLKGHASFSKEIKKVGKDRRAYHSRLRHPENANKRQVCPAQLLHRLKEIAAKLGRTPTMTDLKNSGVTPSMLAYRFGSIRNAQAQADLIPNTSKPFKPRYERDQLLGFIRSFYDVHGRVPGDSDARRGLIPSRRAYCRIFGSFKKALNICGLDNQTRDWRKVITRQELLSKIKSVCVRLERAPSIAEWTELARAERLPNYSFILKFFGTWKRAMRLAGFTSFGKGPYHKRYISDEKLIGEFRRMTSDIGREPNTTDWLKNHKRLGCPNLATYMRRFGTWKKVRLSARNTK